MSRGLVIALWIVGVIVVAGLIGMFFGTRGIKQAIQLKLGDLNLASVADGTYRGTYENGRFTNTVEVKVVDHKIVSITIIDNQAGARSESGRALFDKVINKQSLDIDGISGATATNKSYLKAIENALLGAGNR